MDSNPFAIDIIDTFDSGLPEFDRLILHEDALEALSASLRGPAKDAVPERGRFVLLISPQPGLGKTHLLARMKRASGVNHLMIPLHFRRESPADWASAIGDVLRCADAAPGRSGEIRLLEERARHFFAELTANLIRAGEIPCPNTEEALRALTDHPVDVFDFASGRGDVVKWFCNVFETLVPAFADEAARCYEIDTDEAEFWLRELYDYSRDRARRNETPAESRVCRFLEGEESAWAGVDERSVGRERFTGLGKILGGKGSLTYVADHLDDLFGSEERGKEIAGLLLEIPRLLPRSATVLSVNADLWESIFDGKLPGALEDRMTNNRIALRGIALEEAERLIENRLMASGIPDDVKFRFLPQVGLQELFDADPQHGPTPRHILRHARECWEAFALAGYGTGEEGGGSGEHRERASGIGEKGNAGAQEEPVAEEDLSGRGDVEEEATLPPVEKAGRAGVEFVSLTEDPMKSPDYEPLEPLRFEKPLTTKPISPAAKLESELENGPAARRPAEATPPRSNTPEPFDWEAAAAANDRVKKQMDPAAPAKATPPPLPTETRSPKAAAEPEPDSKPEPVPEPEAVEADPELAETVGNIMEEAEKAFSGFRDIFRQVLSGDQPPAGQSEEEAVEEAPSVESAPQPEPEEAIAPEKEAAAAPAPDTESGSSAPAVETTGDLSPELPKTGVPDAPPKQEVSPEPRPEPRPKPEAKAETVEPAPPESVAPEPAAANAAHLPAYFNRLRQESLKSISSTDLDLLRFYRVIRAVGEIFPVVNQSEFDLPGRPNYRVVGWSYDSTDILFGFLGAEYADYWRALVQYAQQIEAGAGGGAWADGARSVKLVAFTPSGLPLDVASWLAALNLAGIPGSLIDIVEVDPQTVAGVHAAARLVEGIEARSLPYDAATVHGLVTNELDYFWRRLTRPKASVGSSTPIERR